MSNFDYSTGLLHLSCGVIQWSKPDEKFFTSGLLHWFTPLIQWSNPVEEKIKRAILITPLDYSTDCGLSQWG